MDAPYQGGPDVHVLPTSLTLPGVGVLTVNAYVLLAKEPVLVDTGIAGDRDEFIAALSSVIDPDALRWVWLTHDDADHAGNIEAVLEIAPRARIVTQALSAMRMATWWPVPFGRVHAIRPGDKLAVGDRTLTAVRPPIFDNPMSTGFTDSRTASLFTVDAFGGIIPEPTQDAAEIPRDALAGGMLAWATADAPWAHLVDRTRFGQVIEGVRRLQPSRIFSSHLPAVSGGSLDGFLQLLHAVPDAEPFMPPNYEQFAQMVAAMGPAASEERSPQPAGR